MHLRHSVRIALLAGVVVCASPGIVHAQGKPTTLKGYVIDSACAYIKGLKKPISKKCAMACARAGSPLAILADDGHLYLPISEKMPADGQNARLLKFAGQRVVITGRIYERDGSRALVIDTLEPEGSGS